MARDHAQIRLDMWGDDDWRKLSPAAQHLYMLLLTSPSLNLCGVADWRPARIARLAGDWSTSRVLQAADELTDRLFLVIDDETEEVLIRSFVRHDGLMKQPNMATAMATAHAAIASSGLRGVVVHELRRLKEKQPDLAGWRSQKATEVLAREAVNPSRNPSVDPSVKGSVDPSVDLNPNPSVDPCPTPTPTPTPTPKTSRAAKKETAAPDNFEITDGLRKWAKDNRITVDLERETEIFLNRNRAKGSAYKDWNSAWRMWMGNAVKYAQQRSGVAVGVGLNPRERAAAEGRPYQPWLDY